MAVAAVAVVVWHPEAVATLVEPAAVAEVADRPTPGVRLRFPFQ
jgi:hypothetical protein